MKYPIAIAALTVCWLTAASALGQDYYNSGEFARFMAEGDAMMQAQQHQPAPPVKQYDPEAAVAAGIKPSPPIPPRQGGWANANEAGRATDRYNQELERYNNALERWNAQQIYEWQQAELREINLQTDETFRQQHVVTRRNPETGMIEPIRDDEGNIQYHPGKDPITYDEMGHAVQMQRTEAGPSQVALDKDAPIDTHPDRPNELYKQNKYSPWDYLGTVQEGLQSSDSDVQKAAQSAQLKLDKRLHGDSGNDLRQERAYRANPLFAPLMDEHDQLRDDHKKANGALDQIANDYTKRLRPIEQELRQRQNQIAPLQAEVEALNNRLERLGGINAAQSGDPKLAARIQTILNFLEPAAAELRQRQAEFAPVAQAHEALQAEGAQAWQTQHDQLEAQLAPRRQDWQDRFDQARAKEHADMGAGEFKTAPKQ